jgi:hypothetical protein
MKQLAGYILTAALLLGWPARAAEWWTPSPGARFDIQLESPRPDRALPVDVLKLDLDDTSTATIRSLKARGVRLVCYFSAGTFEDFDGRADRAAYEALRPLGVIGRPLAAFADESWVDIRRLDRLGPLLRARMERCRRKGFDAVDPDNVDAYTYPAAATGFPLTAADQLAFNRWLARTAHEVGLGVALKNDLDQVDELAGDFDFAVNESCFRYRECGRYGPLRARAKPVFVIEYRSSPNLTWCRQAAARRDGLIFKRDTGQVDSVTRRCPGR